jgi:hypothetical protein
MESYMSYLAALFVTPAHLVVSRKFHHAELPCAGSLVSDSVQQGWVIFQTGRRYALL